MKLICVAIAPCKATNNGLLIVTTPLRTLGSERELVHAMNGRYRTTDEVAAALREQRSAMRSSCKAYDVGELWEAKRLATCVYVLVSDGRGNSRNRSILQQLDLKGMPFVDSARIPFLQPQDLGFEMPPLIYVASDHEAGPRFEPACRIPDLMDIKQKSFAEWWSQPIFDNRAGLSLTRQNIIFAMRNQDNGAHFDEKITTPAYLQLAERAVEYMFFWRTNADGNIEKVKPPPLHGHLATVRQIAYEMEATLYNRFGDIPPLLPHNPTPNIDGA